MKYSQIIKTNFFKALNNELNRHKIFIDLLNQER
jgi:hypothetical protein